MPQGYTEVTASKLTTPSGPIPYWVIFDDGYVEEYQDEGNLTQVLIAVKWDDSVDFKRYALGFTEYINGNNNYFRRFLPLRCPWTGSEDQYCTKLRKAKLTAGGGADTGTGTKWHFADPLFNNWFNLDGTGGRILYEATFTNPKYDILEDSQMGSAGAELKRYVTRKRGINPKERKTPPFAYEIYDSANPANTASPPCITIPEVGFVPWTTQKLTYVWNKVPFERVPDTAIAKCTLRVNDAMWDYKRTVDPVSLEVSYTWGKYLKGNVLFTGLAAEIEPYRGPNAEWLCNLPYTFVYQPGDNPANEDNWNKAPRNDPTAAWGPLRVRGTNPPKPLYDKADFKTLFMPEP